MKRILLCLTIALLALSCRKEKELKPLSEYESADVQARAYNFQVYPGSRFLQAQTDLLRRAHFVLHPDSKEAPPMAMYESDVPLETAVKFYMDRYGYKNIAPDSTANFSSVKPQAYYTSGDLASDTAELKPILEKLNMNTDMANAAGKFRGAYIAPEMNLPRVSLQRPYYDLLDRKVVDKTLIVMVKE